MAARIERLKQLARDQPELPASQELTPFEQEALVLLKRRFKKRNEEIDDAPTIAKAVRWIADLGGYVGAKSSGPPGSIVIARGLAQIAAAAHVIEQLHAAVDSPEISAAKAVARQLVFSCETHDDPVLEDADANPLVNEPGGHRVRTVLDAHRAPFADAELLLDELSSLQHRNGDDRPSGTARDEAQLVDFSAVVAICEHVEIRALDRLGDLRVCVRCGGKLTVRAVFTDPAPWKLLHLGRCRAGTCYVCLWSIIANNDFSGGETFGED